MTDARKLKRLYAVAKGAIDTSKKAIKDEKMSEDEFDAILDAESEALDNLIDALVDFGRGILTRTDATIVVNRRFEKVGNLIDRLIA